VVSVPCPGGEFAGVDTLSRKALIVVADWIREVRTLSSVNLDTFRIDHPPPSVVSSLFLGWEVFISQLDRIPELRIVTEHFDGVGYRFSFDHHPDRHAAADLDEPRLAPASGRVEHGQVAEVEAVELAGSPHHDVVRSGEQVGYLSLAGSLSRAVSVQLLYFVGISGLVC
jgi:hypothetical protein